MEVQEQNNKSMVFTGIWGLLLSLLLFGCGAEKKHAESIGEEIPYSLQEGKRLFMHYCAICHGENGDGSGRYYGSGLDPMPADFTQEAFFSERNDSRLYTAISEGSASVGRSNLCPPWGFTLEKEEIEFLIGYIKTFVQEEPEEAQQEEYEK